MPNKLFQDNLVDNFTRPPCAQQQSQYPSYTVPSATMNNTCNNMCDFVYGTQPLNRNQTPYTQTSMFYPDQLDSTNWIPDPRAVADIERGLRFSDKMETIEITSKDLSPASCCSNIDLLIPDFYKTINGKENNFYNKPAVSDAQWYCSQKYVDYPSCAQMSFSGNNFVNTEKSNNEFDGNVLKSYCYNDPNSIQYVQQNITMHTNQTENVLSDCNLYNSYGTEATVPNHQMFYSQNDAVSFEDVNNLEQPTVDVSNDESDIIVEESEDEVTDCSEDLERRYDYSTNCIVCNVLYTPIGSQFYILTAETPLTMSSQKPVFSKLMEIVGKLSTERNYLCSHCLGIINTIDHLQLKLETSKFELYNKYENTCKENNLPVKTNTRQSNKTLCKFKYFCGLHSFKCKVCKKLFSIKKLYEWHMMRHKFKNRFLCELCGRQFSKYLIFRKHLGLHNKSKRKKEECIMAFSCKICKKPFRTNTNLKDHENYCSGNLPYICKHSNCDKKFATSTNLKKHVKLKHDKKFVAICSICNIGFIKISDYKSHKITHSTEKKFNCTKCNKSYKTLSNLNHHMKFHNEKLPFICTICNKGFMRKEYLESHVNNHNGIKNFSCQFCSKKFVSQKNLDVHLKYHEGNIKKKVCNVCNKVITTGFDEHVRTHSNLREFECNLCLMKFNTKGTLAKHVKRKHIKN